MNKIIWWIDSRIISPPNFFEINCVFEIQILMTCFSKYFFHTEFDAKMTHTSHNLPLLVKQISHITYSLKHFGRNQKKILGKFTLHTCVRTYVWATTGTFWRKTKTRRCCSSRRLSQFCCLLLRSVNVMRGLSLELAPVLIVWQSAAIYLVYIYVWILVCAYLNNLRNC